MKVLIDTHVAVWMATQNSTLGLRSTRLLHEASRDGRLCISAISFWEVALLQARNRLSDIAPAEALRQSLLQTGVVEVPLSGDIAVLATQLDLHGDPADRFIAASALAWKATLVTADERLLAFTHALPRQDARL